MGEKTIKHKSTGSPEDNDSVPCFIAIYDPTSGIHWAIPISSQVAKYKAIYQSKVARYKVCDTIVFGEVLGFERAFLIQNMLPITEEFVGDIYLDKNNIEVRVVESLNKELTTKAKKVLALQKKGMKLIFGDVFGMEAKLKNNDMTKESTPEESTPEENITGEIVITEEVTTTVKVTITQEARESSS